MFKKFFNWIRDIVKRQHYERKAMPKYYHDKLCLFDLWISEDKTDKVFHIFMKLLAMVSVGLFIGFATL